MTNTMQFGSLMRWRRGGQSEVKHSPTRLVRRSPKVAAMRLDNGAADGQSHSDAFRFGGEKGRKQPGRLLWIDSRAGISHGH